MVTMSRLAMRIVTAGLLAGAAAGCTEDDGGRAEECGGLGAACCLAYADNPAGYQFTCDLGNACIDQTCVSTVQVGHGAAVIASSDPTAATHHDPSLGDPWGIVGDVHGELLVANRATTLISGYDEIGRPRGVVSKLDAGPLAGVSARQLRHRAFVVDLGGPAPADFLWAHADGRISASRIGERGGKVVLDRTGARYAGLALLPAADASRDRLYAVDQAAGRIDVLDGDLRPVVAPGAFAAPGLAPLVAHGIAQIDGQIWVAYAAPLADGSGAVEPDAGRVVIFDADGVKVEDLAGSDALAAPWAMVRAPESGFGALNGCALVASAGKGTIEAWCKDGGRFAYRGPLLAEDGQPVVIEGLRGIAFGGAGCDGVASLYATARNRVGVSQVWAIQWSSQSRPSWHLCRCACTVGGDVTGTVFHNLYVNSLQFPGACGNQCANDAAIAPAGTTCAPF